MKSKSKPKVKDEIVFVGAMLLALLQNVYQQRAADGTFIRLNQTLRVKLRQCDIRLAQKADRAFDVVKREVEQEGLEIHPTLLIETLFENHRAGLINFLGRSFDSIVTGFVSKNLEYDTDRKICKDSYKVADRLTEEFLKEAKKIAIEKLNTKDN